VTSGIYATGASREGTSKENAPYPEHHPLTERKNHPSFLSFNINF
jgi:hypothetical protein